MYWFTPEFAYIYKQIFQMTILLKKKKVFWGEGENEQQIFFLNIDLARLLFKAMIFNGFPYELRSREKKDTFWNLEYQINKDVRQLAKQSLI